MHTGRGIAAAPAVDCIAMRVRKTKEPAARPRIDFMMSPSGGSVPRLVWRLVNGLPSAASAGPILSFQISLDRVNRDGRLPCRPLEEGSVESAAITVLNALW